MKNAIIILLIKDKFGIIKCLTQTMNNNKIGFPGGVKEHGESLFECMKREFIEECGYKLPFLCKYFYVDYKLTRIYIGSTKQYVKTGIVNTKEVKNLNLININELENEKHILRNCAIESTKYILKTYDFNILF